MFKGWSIKRLLLDIFHISKKIIERQYLYILKFLLPLREGEDEGIHIVIMLSKKCFIKELY